MGAMSITNPMGWAHFRLRGGWKNIATTSGAYVAIILALIILSVRANPLAAKDILYFWTNALLGLQVGALILFACASVNKAIRKDFTTHMIESHRLMPTPASQAIVGYVTGPVLQAVVIAAANFCLGVMTSVASGLSLNDWVLANFILAIFAVCAWLAIALLAMLSGSAMGLMIGTLSVCFMSSATALSVLPGLAILTGPLIGHTVFGIIERGGTWSWAYQVSALAQLVAAGFCFLGAVRKYRREDVLAFGPGMGLLLLVGWVTLSTIGIRHGLEFQSKVFGGFGVGAGVQTIASTLASMLVAIIAVSSAAWLWGQHRRHRALADPVPMPLPTSPEIVIAGAAMVITLLPLRILAGAHCDMRAVFGTFVVSAAFLLSVRYLLGVLFRREGKPAGLIILWILLTWLGPLLVDLLRFTAFSLDEPRIMSWVSTISPIGCMIRLWDGTHEPVAGGLAIQLGAAMMLGMLFYSGESKKPSTSLSAC
jgi:hypothetical protein